MTRKIVASVFGWEVQPAGNFVRGKVFDIDGEPASGYGVVFSGVGPDGEWAILQPDITGPHSGYENWEPGYFSTILRVGGAVLAKFWLWLVDLETGKRVSDIAIIDNTLPGLNGASQCVCDFYVIEEHEEPPVITPITEEIVRETIWNALTIPYNPDAAMMKAARANGLGNPVTEEITIGDHVAQGFSGGIVWAKRGDWSRIQISSY